MKRIALAILAFVFLLSSGLAEQDFSQLLNRMADYEDTSFLSDTDAKMLKQQLAENPNDWLANCIMYYWLINNSAYTDVDAETYRKVARANFPWDYLRTADWDAIFQYENDAQMGIAYLYAARFMVDADQTEMAKPLLVAAIQKLSSCTAAFEAVYEYFAITLYAADSLIQWARETQDMQFYNVVVPALESCKAIEFKEDPEYAQMLITALCKDSHVCIGYHALCEGHPEEALAAADQLEAACQGNDAYSEFEYLLFCQRIRAEAYVQLNDAAAVESELQAYVELTGSFAAALQKDPMMRLLLGNTEEIYWRSLNLGKEMYELAKKINRTDLTEHWYGMDDFWHDLLNNPLQ